MAFGREAWWILGLEKGVGFCAASGEDLIEILEGFFGPLFEGSEAQLDHPLAAWGNIEDQVGGDFGANAVGIERVYFAVDDGFVEGVFEIRGVVGCLKNPLVVGLIFGEEPGGVGGGGEAKIAEGRMGGDDRAGVMGSAPDLWSGGFG